MSKRIPFIAALIPIIITVSLMILTVMYLNIPLYIPLLMGFIITLITALFYGAEPKQIFIEAKKGIKSISTVFLVLLLIGVLIAIWSSSGTIDALVYYGLAIIQPEHLIIVSFLVSSAISMLLGTSVGTASTVGIAFMGMAHSIGVNPEIVAGAIVSGAFVGDRTSPLSAVGNINTIITGTKYHDNFQELLKTLIPAMIFTILAYWIIEHSSLQIDNESISIVASARAELLNIYGYFSLWLLLPPLSIMVLAFLKVSIRINLLVGSLIGAIMAYIFQERTILDLFNYAVFGFNHPNGNIFGGGWRMFNQVLLIIISGAFYGLLEASGILATILHKTTERLNTAKAVIQKTMLISIFSAVLTSTQVMSVIIPGKVMLKHFEEFRLKPKLLNRLIADSGMVVAGLIPWNLNALLLGIALHVSVTDYLPYAYFLIIMPIYSYSQTLWQYKEKGNFSKKKLAKKEEY